MTFLALILTCGALGLNLAPHEQVDLSKPTWADEFAGSSLNERVWTDWIASFQGRNKGFLFARDNVSVSNGCLNLTARRLRPEERTIENVRRGFDTHATALVRAKEKTFYGYYECRARTMRACVCNAFWLYDPLSDMPEKKFRPGDTSEEIDIFEIFGKLGTIADSGCERALYSTVHRLKTPYLEGLVNGGVEKLENRTKTTRVDFDFWADFHTFGFLWTKDRLVWYLDGREIFSRVNDHFHRPLHVTFDCEIMHGWTGLPDDADLPAVYSIDYFRYFMIKYVDNENKGE